MTLKPILSINMPSDECEGEHCKLLSIQGSKFCHSHERHRKALQWHADTLKEPLPGSHE